MSEQDQRKGPNGAGHAAGSAALPKRFYKDVAVAAEEGGRFGLRLDGKAVRTPGKAPLAVPRQALADAIAEEWRAQGERVDPRTMPLTKLANTTIDGVEGRAAAVVDDILAHARADLLCYRASGPEGLRDAQARHWDPVVAWAKEALNAPLALAEGIVHVAQPEASIEALRREVEKLDAFSLAALHVLTTLSGSALLALAVALKHLDPAAAWAAAHVDEDFQIGQWGEDAEAKARRVARKAEFDAATRLLDLVH